MADSPLRRRRTPEQVIKEESSKASDEEDSLSSSASESLDSGTVSKNMENLNIITIANLSKGNRGS